MDDRCKVRGCRRKRKSGTLCGTHKWRLDNNGDVYLASPWKRPQTLPDDWPESSLAWAAGIIEGEGSFHYGIKPGEGMDVVVAMKDPDVIEGLRYRLGGGDIRERPNEGMWVWRVGKARDLKVLLPRLMPWLGARRCLQVQNILDSIARKEQAMETYIAAGN